MILQVNRRYVLLSACILVLLLSIASLNSNLRSRVYGRSHELLPPEKPHLPPHPIYKPEQEVPIPIKDNFPLGSVAASSSDLPPIPSWNRPPSPHLPDLTPLFIGFTRNWPLLQQTVVSYITAGWPPEDIYVIENTGTMDANKHGKLTLQNPSYLDYNRLTNVFGINVISTPTLLSFAQLQNFYLQISISRNWTHYFWSHMDVVALSEEDFHSPSDTYSSLYLRTVDDLRYTLSQTYAVDDEGRQGRWAVKFYAYDRMTLMNTAAISEVGGWDTMIPYYGTDCDMYSRLAMAGLKQDDAQTGLVYDLGSSLEDLAVLYRRKPVPADTTGLKKETRDSAERKAEKPARDGNDHEDILARFGPEDDRASDEYIRLRDQLNSMQINKNTDARGRNFWQGVQAGGQGEPFYRDPEGFEIALRMTFEHGQNVMAEKWGHRGCDLMASGLGLGDQWRVEHDWDRSEKAS